MPRSSRCCRTATTWCSRKSDSHRKIRAAWLSASCRATSSVMWNMISPPRWKNAWMIFPAAGSNGKRFCETSGKTSRPRLKERRNFAFARSSIHWTRNSDRISSLPARMAPTPVCARPVAKVDLAYVWDVTVRLSAARAIPSANTPESWPSMVAMTKPPTLRTVPRN